LDKGLALAVADGLVLEVVGAFVHSAWADEAVVGQLLEHAGGPAGSAGDREERGEQIRLSRA